MRVYVLLRCEDQFAPQARYVFSTFCKVLGLDLIELPTAARAATQSDGPIVCYGPAEDLPAARAGLIRIHSAPDVATFFAGRQPKSVKDVGAVSWDGRRVPFLFDPDPVEVEAGRSDALLSRRSSAVDMSHDLVASAFYFLSRWEEIVIVDRDEHGRFPYTRSLAAQLDLSENIVDVYLDLFVAMLNLAGDGKWPVVEIPEWDGGVPFVACLTHDVDEISKSRLSRMKFVWDHLIHPEAGHRHTPIRDRARFALGTLVSRHDPYWTFPTMAKLERQLGFTASYFFQAGERGNGTGYSLSEGQVRDFIDDLVSDGFEVGLHGTYRSAFDEGMFRQEKNALVAITNQELFGHRQHYLRMEYATTLPIYERAGLQYDATLGYAEREGYRNQFSYPYHPYNHAAARPFRFLELPTVIMDATLGGYRELDAEHAWQVIERWLEQARARRGCITLLWHNPWDGVYPGYFQLYPRILTWVYDHGGAGLSGRDVWRQWQAR
jgi:hypothetical protein